MRRFRQGCRSPAPAWAARSPCQLRAPRAKGGYPMTFSVKDLTARYRVSQHTILAWIRSGELRAFSVGRRLGTRKPRWRITAEALAEFELLRTAAPPHSQKRRQKRPENVIQF